MYKNDKLERALVDYYVNNPGVFYCKFTVNRDVLVQYHLTIEKVRLLVFEGANYRPSTGVTGLYCVVYNNVEYACTENVHVNITPVELISPYVTEYNYTNTIMTLKIPWIIHPRKNKTLDTSTRNTIINLLRINAIERIKLTPSSILSFGSINLVYDGLQNNFCSYKFNSYTNPTNK